MYLIIYHYVYSCMCMGLQASIVNVTKLNYQPFHNSSFFEPLLTFTSNNCCYMLTYGLIIM